MVAPSTRRTARPYSSGRASCGRLRSRACTPSAPASNSAASPRSPASAPYSETHTGLPSPDQARPCSRSARRTPGFLRPVARRYPAVVRTSAGCSAPRRAAAVYSGVTSAPSASPAPASGASAPVARSGLDSTASLLPEPNTIWQRIMALRRMYLRPAWPRAPQAQWWPLVAGSRRGWRLRRPRPGAGAPNRPPGAQPPHRWT